MFQVLILGLISAGIYAMFAIGVVLVYRGTKVLTFAGGEIGTMGLFFAYLVVTKEGAPWIVGALVAVVFAAVVGVLFEVVLVSQARDSDPIVTSILTVGFAVLLLAIEFKAFGATPRDLAPPIKGGFQIDNVVVSPTQIAAIVLAAGLGFGLQAFLRRTDFGLGILAAADDPTATRLVGVPVANVRIVLWAASFGLAALAALFVEPTVGVISPGYASTLYLSGLAAAVIGGLTSLPGAVVGSVVLGIAQAAAARYLKDAGIPGLDYVVTLVILLVTLLGRAYRADLQRWLASSPLRQEAAA